MATLLAAAVCVSALAVLPSTAAPPGDTSPCPRAETRATLKSFLGAFNAGEFARLDRLFADPPQFQWYSSGNPGRRLGAEAKKRRTLIPYFKRRRSRGDRMRNLAVDINRPSPRWSNFGFELERSVPDYQDGDWLEVVGKGAAICEEGQARFIVLTLGDAKPG